jgi:hypothetical protein
MKRVPVDSRGHRIREFPHSLGHKPMLAKGSLSAALLMEAGRAQMLAHCARACLLPGQRHREAHRAVSRLEREASAESERDLAHDEQTEAKALPLALRIDDEHPGFSFTLLLRRLPQGGLPPGLQASLQAAGVRSLAIDGPATGPACVGDADGRYRALMDELAADAVLLRPDFVLYGHARFDALTALLEGYLAQLRCLSVPEPA